MRQRSIHTALGFALLLLSPSLRAQELPAADDLIRRYVEAIGGSDAHLAPSSIRTTGTVSMPGLGIEGEFEVIQILPDQSVFRATLPGIGEQVLGYDGRVGWSMNSLLGPMLLEGAELEQARERAHVLGDLRDPAIVPGRETVELSEFEGEACWRVRLEWASGRESHDCFSADSGLLIASEDVELTPMGPLPVTTLLSDYREHGGMLIPMRMIQRVMGQDQEVTVTSVELNGVTAAELELPPPVRTLLEGAPVGTP